VCQFPVRVCSCPLCTINRLCILHNTRITKKTQHQATTKTPQETPHKPPPQQPSPLPRAQPRLLRQSQDRRPGPSLPEHTPHTTHLIFLLYVLSRGGHTRAERHGDAGTGRAQGGRECVCQFPVRVCSCPLCTINRLRILHNTRITPHIFFCFFYVLSRGGHTRAARHRDAGTGRALHVFLRMCPSYHTTHTTHFVF